MFKQTPRAMVTGKQNKQKKLFLQLNARLQIFTCDPGLELHWCLRTLIPMDVAMSFTACLAVLVGSLSLLSEGSKIADWKEVECPVFTVHANLAPLSKCLQFLVLCRMEVHS